jgi:hypothetical protein
MLDSSEPDHPKSTFVDVNEITCVCKSAVDAAAVVVVALLRFFI